MKTKRKYKKNKIRKQKGGEEEGIFSKFGEILQRSVNSAKNNVPSFFGSLKNRAMGNFNSVKSKLCNMGGSKKTQKNRKKYKKHK
jgi:hypothetical protein